jgi:hypothetical protein
MSSWASRLLFLGAVVAGFAGWSLFFAAAAYAARFSPTHGLLGYEVIWPLLIWPCGAVWMIRMPRRRDGHDREEYERLLNIRLWAVIGFTMLGGMMGVVFTMSEWFLPAPHMERPPVTAMAWSAPPHMGSAPRGVFSSESRTPSPSPRPQKVEVPTPPDPVTGGLLLGQLALLAASNMMMWLYVTEADHSAGQNDPFALD